jgi:hypothetical protein
VDPLHGTIAGVDRARTIHLPLTYNEQGRIDSTPWTREGAGPLISPKGMRADGEQSRYTTRTLPSWVASSLISVQATITPDMIRPKNGAGSSDVAVYIGEDTLAALPHLELGTTQDPIGSTLQGVVVRSYSSGAVVSEYLGRASWSYEFRFPVLTAGQYQVRPQGIFFKDADHVLVTGHYQDTESRAYLVRISDGVTVGGFTFGSNWFHVASMAKRSNGDIWVADYQTNKMLRIDLTASLASGTVVVLQVYDTSIISGVSAIEFVTVNATEYLLLGLYATSGTPYIYVIPTSKLDAGETFQVTDRYKRFSMGTHVQGIAISPVNDKMYVARNNYQGGSDLRGYVQTYDIRNAITSTADEGTLAPIDTFDGPSQFCEDIKFHPTTERLWMPTEGLTGVGSNLGFLGVWSSDLSGGQRSTYTLTKTAGGVEIKANGRVFDTPSWSPSITPAVVSIGGPPVAASGMQSRFFSGMVRDVRLQDSRISRADHRRTVEDRWGAGELTSWDIPLVNPGAELGTTSGWTNEVGSMGTRNVSPTPLYGAWYFFGGPNLQTIASQRVDITTTVGPVSTGSWWAVVEWMQSSFDSTADLGALGIRALSSDTTIIASGIAPSVWTPNSGATGPWWWYTRRFGLELPAGTKYIEVVQRYDRTAGTNLDAYIDSITLTVFQRSP